MSIRKCTSNASRVRKFIMVFTGVGYYIHYTADIQVKSGSTPFFQRAASYPLPLRKPARERLDYFVKLGILEHLPVGSPVKYASRMLVVPKPNKPDEVCLVADSKRLNLQLARTRAVQQIGLKIFAVLQMASNTFSNPTVLSTFDGNFKWKGLPQGLLMSGDIFDQVMESDLCNCVGTSSVRDDILGGGVTKKAMLEESEKVLTALEASGLTCDPKKQRSDSNHSKK